MDEYTIIGLLVGGFIVGWYTREWQAMRRVKTMLDQINSEETIVNPNTVNITVEKHDGCIYIYGSDGTYLTHGLTFKIVEDDLKSKFPGKLFAASKEDLLKLNQ